MSLRVMLWMRPVRSREGRLIVRLCAWVRVTEPGVTRAWKWVNK